MGFLGSLNQFQGHTGFSGYARHRDLKFSIDKIDRSNSNTGVEECNFKDDITAKKQDECNITLKIYAVIM